LSELKAYACTEPEEHTGGVIFAKSNIEARKWAAREWNDGELAGMSVKRAPWADKYGSDNNVPISVMVDNGWHFECAWSGLRIDSDLYNEPQAVKNEETGKWEDDNFLIGKEPVGFQNDLLFACQEYRDLYKKEQQRRKEYEEEMKSLYRGYVLSKLPEAVLVDSKEFGKGEYIWAQFWEGIYYVTHATIPFEFPGMKHWAAFKIEQKYGREIGPFAAKFTCAQADYDEFVKWIEIQKEIRNG